MHQEEAVWIAEVFADQQVEQFSPLLNIGSSTAIYRRVYQPFIESLIFGPLKARGARIIHQDVKQDEGVDICGDLTDPDFMQSLKKLRVRSILCSNLLEHLDDPAKIASGIADIARAGSIIVVTVPFKYPKHRDPIDTMFRPDTEQVAKLFPGTRIMASRALDVGTVWNDLGNNPFRLIKLMARLLAPFYRFNGWLTVCYKLPWLFRPRKITCVVLRKDVSAL